MHYESPLFKNCLRSLTLICLTKNLVYKNIEAQMRKKIRTIVRTSSASNVGESKNIWTSFVAAKNNPFYDRWINIPHYTQTEIDGEGPGEPSLTS